MRDTRTVRASGLQSGNSPGEVIELLDDDTDAFGDRASMAASDSGGRRWAAPLAGLALAGAIAYVVVSSVSSSDGPGATVAPSTTAASTSPTTIPRVARAVPSPSVPYVAATPPLGYELMSADESTAPTSFDGDYGYQLWVSSGYSAPVEAWFSIRSWGGGGVVFSAQDAYRVEVGGRSIAIGHRPTGVTTADFSIDNKLGVTLTSSGLSDGNLVRVASSIVDDGTHAVLSSPALLDGFRRVSTVPALLAIQGSPTVHAYYAISDDPRDNFSINVAPVDLAGDASGITPEARTVAMKYGLSRSTTFEVDGHDAVAGVLADQPELALASWRDGDSIITVTSMMPVSRLVVIARSVHTVSATDWQVMKRQGSANLAAANRTYPFQEQTSEPVSFGTDANGTRWTVRVANATFGDTPQLAWHWSGSNATTDPSNTAQIHTFLDQDQTFVVADVPRVATPTATLRITLAGREPIDVPFQDLGPEYDHTVAAYAFSEAGPYTAETLSADGRVLARWSALP